MKKIYLKTIGNFIQDDNLEDSDCSRKTRDFFTRLGKEVGKISRKHFDFFGLPFVYRERQVNSLIAVALSRFVNHFACEIPIDRKYKNKEDNGHGWVDFCASYRDCVFLIELKHEYMSLRSGIITEGLKRQWQEADDQLKTISKADIKYYKQHGRGLIKCSLLFVPHYITANKREEGKISLLKNHNLLIDELNPDLSLLWNLHEDMTEKHEIDEGIFQRFLGVSLASKIYPTV